ncbi:viral capsid associated protein 91 [Neodiprion abietis nucleopolyhedrovirus]|uniref:Viral capsid associated protein 91 n=1 Tax=Neodiprion abietis nucleopolyhedrovirus TaxID=204507 RepID=Q0ZNZ3_9CBAC|nr:viral capsid associated protein 91 [Neodiprion abietis nucleopolyhedrovirus]ABC74961.1 viral capsid associated protein 91 [Neodiprion abietis nucleopolyhedrovirus]
MFLIVFVFLCILLIFFTHNIFVETTDDVTKYKQIHNLLLEAYTSDLVSFDTVSFISRVRWPVYEIVTFETETYTMTNNMWYSGLEKRFNFYNQTFEDVDDNAERVTTVDSTSFSLHVDDGWVNVDCPANMIFDGYQCVRQNICENQTAGTILPVNEALIDVAFYQKYNRSTTTDTIYHPTLYIVCNGDDTYEIKECDNNQLFDSEMLQCVDKDACADVADYFVLSDRPDTLADDEYLMCLNNETTVQTCEENMIFDTTTLSCVEVDLCQANGVGYTYITDDLAANQYYRCTSVFDKEIVSCPIRVETDGQYSCAGDTQCMSLENGSGSIVTMTENTHFKYASEAVICTEYEITDSIVCDSEEVELSVEPFTLDLKIPTTILDRTNNVCKTFDINDVEIITDYAGIVNSENDYNVDFTTAVRVNVQNLLSENLPVSTSMLFSSLDYAKNYGFIGFSPLTGNEIDCYGDILFDIFAGDKYNICSDNEISSSNAIDDNEFFSTYTKNVGTTTLTSPCRVKSDIVLEDDIYIQESDNVSVSCLYAMPLQEIIVTDLEEAAGVLIDDKCSENGIDLNNVAGAIVILNDELACRSVYLEDYNVIITASFTPTMKFEDRTWNVDTQSYDGVMYDSVVHKITDGWMACPPSAYDKTTTDCNIDNTKLYTVKDLHFVQNYPDIDYEPENEVNVDTEDVDVSNPIADDVEAINPIAEDVLRQNDNVTNNVQPALENELVNTATQMEVDQKNPSINVQDIDSSSTLSDESVKNDYSTLDTNRILDYINRHHESETSEEEYMDDGDILASLFE